MGYQISAHLLFAYKLAEHVLGNLIDCSLSIGAHYSSEELAVSLWKFANGLVSGIIESHKDVSTFEGMEGITDVLRGDLGVVFSG